MDTLSWGPPSPALSHQLQALRAVGDPPLDRLLLAHEGRSLAPRWLEALAAPGRSPALPPALSLDLPSWAQLPRINRACVLFQRHAVPLAMLLGSASLLECFACAQGARDLHAARTFPRDPRSRVGRTGRFVLDVLRPAAWADGSTARTLARVRILHAVTRQQILHAPPTMTTTTVDEAPLCQEDQLGTLLAFGLSPLLHLRAQGVSISTREVEDMLHLWRVAGHLLGVAVEHLPETEPATREVAAAIRARCFAPSPEGRVLTAGVLDAYARVVGSPAVHAGFLRWLRAVVGEATCDLLGVAGPAAGTTGRVLSRGSGAIWRSWGELQRLPGAGRLREAVQAGLRHHAEGMAAGGVDPLHLERAA